MMSAWLLLLVVPVTFAFGYITGSVIALLKDDRYDDQ